MQNLKNGNQSKGLIEFMGKNNQGSGIRILEVRIRNCRSLKSVDVFLDRLTVLIGTNNSGKTSFLNICMPFIPPNHRIISIEDTRELQLPDYLYWCPLTTREPNPEGKGEVSMEDLESDQRRSYLEP